MGTALHNLEPVLVQVRFVMQLYDGFTGTPQLVEDVTVSVANKEVAMPKPDRAQYVFFNLAAGATTVDIGSDSPNPAYLPVSIALTLPMSSALWPAYPDRALANPNLPLDDAGQPAVYKNQLALATLQPSTRYPFPQSANLARGTVRVAGVPLAGATVSRVGGTELYLTGADGEYVLFFLSINGVGEAANLQVTHPSHATVNAAVTLNRGTTLVQDFVMV